MNKSILLDRLYVKFDKDMRAGRWGRINKIMKQLNPFTTDIDYLIGILTVTLPAKSKLDYRETFFNRCDIQCSIRKLDADSLLKGLF